jgi:hypothetical protein
MLEVELDEVVRVAVLKELAAIQATLGQGAHELAHAQVAIAEQGLGAGEALAFHDVLIAEHLAVDGADQGFFVLAGADGPVFVVAVVGEPFNAEVGSVDKGHGKAGWGREEAAIRQRAVPQGVAWSIPR